MRASGRQSAFFLGLLTVLAFVCVAYGQAPRNLTVESRTTSSVVLSWLPPVEAPAGTGYRLRAFPAAGGAPVSTYPSPDEPATSDTSNVTLPGLSPATSYAVNVVAVSSDGEESEPTDTIAARTLPACCDENPAVPELALPDNAVEQCSVTGVDLSPEAQGFASLQAVQCEDPEEDADVEYEDTLLEGDCPSRYQIIRVWRARDACDRQLSGEQLLEVVNPQAPSLDVPPAVEIACEDERLPNATGYAQASHPCGPVNVTWADEVDSTTVCPAGGNITRTWTAVDECNNTAVGTQQISVAPEAQRPEEALAVTAPPHVTLTPCNASTDPDDTGRATFAQPCNDDEDAVELTFDDTELPGACNGSRIVRRVWTAVDACNDTDSAVQIIHLNDDVAPTLVVPPDVTLPCGVPPATEGAAGQATATDACGPVVELSFTDSEGESECPGSGNITRTWRAVDACGNEATAVQQIGFSAPAPGLSVIPPAFIELPCTSEFGPDVTGFPNYTGACPETPAEGPEISFSDSEAVGECEGTTIVTRTWTVVDGCDQTVSANQTIVLADTEPPTLVVPPDVTLPCGVPPATEGAAGQANATDACGPVVELSFTDSEGESECPGSGNITRTWRAVDACGNEATAVQQIGFAPDVPVPPVELNISAPADQTVSCDASVSPDETGEPVVDGGCPEQPPAVSFTDARQDMECPFNYDIVRTWTAVDGCDPELTASADQLIQVRDTTAPTLTVPEDTTVSCSESNRPANTGRASATDDCDPAPVITFIDRVEPGECPHSWFINRTFIARDACLNEARATQRVTVVDDEPPILEVPADITVQCFQSLAPNNTGVARATDGCDPAPAVSYSDEVIPGECPQERTVRRTWTATDACGNVAEAVQTISVIDTVPPRLSVPADVSMQCANVDPERTGRASASDNCGANVTVSYTDEREDGGCPNRFVLRRTWTAVDECGNTASEVQVITVNDTRAPRMCVPPDLEVSCSDSVDPQATGMPHAIDNCDGGEVELSFADETTEDECPHSFLLTRTWTARDRCNNTATAVQTIRVHDTVAPTLTVPPNITLDCSASSEPNQTGVARAVDNCDNDPQVSFEDSVEEGDCPGERIITRVWTATDSCNNTVTASQTIVFTNDRPPQVDGVRNVTVACDANTDPGSVGGVTASDPCGGEVDVSFTDEQVDGECPNGSLRRTWEVTDACGNTATVVQMITRVESPPAPPAEPDFEFSAPENVTQPCWQSSAPSQTGFGFATTACDEGGVTVGYADTVEEGECPQSRVVHRRWTASDQCGNEETAVQTISLVDEEPPVLSVPGGVQLQCANLSTAITGHASAADQCDPDVSLTFEDDLTPGDCPNRFTVVRVWTATDACGNTATGNQTIEVSDTTPPRLCVPADSVVSCGFSTEPSATGFALASDNCGAVQRDDITWSDEVEPGRCPQHYFIHRTWTAVDECGNSESDVQEIVVDDTRAPVLAVPPDTVVQCSDSTEPEDVGMATALDDCDPEPSVTYSDQTVEGRCPQERRILRTWTATDACGNSATAVQTIQVVDTQPPKLELPANATVECTDSIEPDFTGRPNVTDLCDAEPVVEWVDEEQPGDCPQARRILRTWRARDACNNTAEAVQHIMVVDTTAPEVQAPPDIEISCEEEPTSERTGVVNVTDNCDPEPLWRWFDTVTAGDCPNEWVITRLWNVFDACGNEANVTQVITVVDRTAPEITVPENSTAACDASLLPEDLELVANATDNCDPEPQLFYSDVRVDGACPSNYTVVRTWTAVDACNNTASAEQFIEVVDEEPPVLSVPPDVRVACNESVEPEETGLANATDNCTFNVTVTYSDATEDEDPGCPHNYVIVRTWTATDDCGHSVSAEQRIEVYDEEPPQLSAPEDVELVCESSVDPDVTGMANASDACGAVTVSFADEGPDFECPFIRTVTRTWTASDECNRTVTATQQIVLTAPPASVSAPSTATVACGDSVDPDETGWPDVDVGCAGITFELEYEDEASEPNDQCPRNITRTWTMTDSCGRTDSDTQLIIVTNNTAEARTARSLLGRGAEAFARVLPDPSSAAPQSVAGWTLIAVGAAVSLVAVAALVALAVRRAVLRSRATAAAAQRPGSPVLPLLQG